MSTHTSLTNILITIAELVISVLMYFVVYVCMYHSWILPRDFAFLCGCMILLWVVLLKRLDLSKVYKINPFSYILLHYLTALACGLLGLIFIIFIFNLSIDRSFLFVFVASDFLFLYCFIISIYIYVKRKRAKGHYLSNILVYGDKNVTAFINKIETNSFWGYKIKGIVSDDTEIILKYENIYPVYNPNEVQDCLVSQPIDELYYCMSDIDKKRISDLVYLCLELGVTFRMSSQIMAMAHTKSEIYYLGETPYFTFQNTPKQSVNMLLKLVFDKVFSFCVLLCLLPFFLIIAVCIKIDSKGPVFFSQKRVGLRGREFKLYKFRSMCDGAEQMLESMKNENEQEGPVFKVKNDKRITRVGKIIRRASIDELPQFFNVLKGDMSVVGPRPPLPDEVKQYKTWQNRRLSMKPGITCIWQVSGRNKIPFEQWMKLDLQYIDTWSIGLDFMIILKTIKTMVMRDGQ